MNDIKTNVTVHESEIHGKGVFANFDMPEGYYVGTYDGPPAGPGYSKFDFHDYESEESRRGRNDLRYMNCDDENPNCDYDGFDCFTTRFIAADEELTFHYNY